MEFTLLWAALAGFASMWIMLRLQRRLGLLSDNRSDWFDLLLGAAMSGLILGRLASMAISGTNPVTHPADVILIRGGVHTGFASIGALLYLIWATRSDRLRALDILAPAVLVGLAGWQGGCLFRATCLGTRSDLPWALAEPGSDLTRHPTEIYAALLFGAAALAALMLLRRSRWQGLVAGGALASAALIRLVTQPFRPSLSSGPIWWYVAGAACGAVLVTMAFLGRLPNNRKPN